MNDEQFDLLGFSEQKQFFHPTPPPGRKLAKYFELFLALRPQRGDAARLSTDIRSLRQRFGSGAEREVLPHLWHITLSAIAQFDESFPQAKLDAIQAACGGIACPVIPVVHDRLIGFAPSGACALLCTQETVQAIRHLRATLAAALKSVGISGKASSPPHLTIFYNKQQPAIAETALAAPITWPAVAFSLVVSHYGLGHHEIVRSWDLQK